MTDGERSPEDREVQQSLLVAATRAAQGQPLVRALGNAAASGQIARAYSRVTSLSQHGVNVSDPYTGTNSLASLVRTRSAVSGPITDHRGLGTLAPYVLPGLLHRASFGLNSQASGANFPTFAGTRLPDFAEAEDARPSTSPAAFQQPQLNTGRCLCCMDKL